MHYIFAFFWWDLVKTVLFSLQLSSNHCELNRKRSSNLIGTVLWPRSSSSLAFTHKHDTGCPNKHENSVTNSISSFQIILSFNIVIPTEKAVICESFVYVVYVHILFVFVWLFWLKIAVCKHCPSSLFILRRHFYSLLPFS